MSKTDHRSTPYPYFFFVFVNYYPPPHLPRATSPHHQPLVPVGRRPTFVLCRAFIFRRSRFILHRRERRENTRKYLHRVKRRIVGVGHVGVGLGAGRRVKGKEVKCITGVGDLRWWGERVGGTEEQGEKGNRKGVGR